MRRMIYNATAIALSSLVLFSLTRNSIAGKEDAENIEEVVALEAVQDKSHGSKIEIEALLASNDLNRVSAFFAEAPDYQARELLKQIARQNQTEYASAVSSILDGSRVELWTESLRTLGSLSQASTLTSISPLTMSDSPYHRLLALQTLHEIDPVSNERYLIAALRDEQRHIRIFALNNILPSTSAELIHHIFDCYKRFGDTIAFNKLGELLRMHISEEENTLSTVGQSIFDKLGKSDKATIMRKLSGIDTNGSH